jgi:uncharacterized membrane protein YccC
VSSKQTPEQVTRREFYATVSVLWVFLFLSLLGHTPSALWVLRGFTFLMAIIYVIANLRLRGRVKEANRAA